MSGAFHLMASQDTSMNMGHAWIWTPQLYACCHGNDNWGHGW